MPETRTGTCPWCGRHNVTLFLTTGISAEEGLWADWICHRCRAAAIHPITPAQRAAFH